MCCELGETFPTGFTFWPRGKLDKIFRTKTIKTGYEDFDKRFNLSCDNEEWVLSFLNQGRLARIPELTPTAFGVCMGTESWIWRCTAAIISLRWEETEIIQRY